MTDKFEVAFKVTSWFETGDTPFTSPSGNFDGQGLSWGPRQNCIGQGSLQPLLRRMFAEQDTVMHSCLTPLMYDQLKDIAAVASTVDQLKKTIALMNDEKNRLLPEWKTAFATLGANPDIQAIFIGDARTSIPAVDDLAKFVAGSRKPTLREWCWSFDTQTQNGGLAKWFRAILAVLRPMLVPFKKDERDWLRTVSWLRAAQTYVLGNRPFALDTLSRKLLIVEGQGRFRGGFEDIDAKFGISDDLVA